ncbi:hypothetical protein BDY24DRAFT_68579 [Mrakia frigida]|uniref:uncharacterized protein n=1 Tax=Mrakia frigida TaxID=29902 RepID=UPI003FCC0AAD
MPSSALPPSSSLSPLVDKAASPRLRNPSPSRFETTNASSLDLALPSPPLTQGIHQVSDPGPLPSPSSRLSRHLHSHRLHIFILLVLLGSAFLLPPTETLTQAPKEWSWSYLNRQQAFGSPWEADEIGVGKGSVANGGWDRTRGGLLVVPKDQKWLRRHPIEVLMKEAGFKAKHLKDTRPRTLSQAVKRYRKMFKMDPPKGFDKWFTAFDFIPSILPPAHESFVPFLSIPGQILRERMYRLDDAGQTFAVEFSDTILLLTPIAHHITHPMTVYFNTDDVPRFIASNQVLNASTTYGYQGEIWPQEERERMEAAQKGTHGWFWPCGRDTPVGMEFRDNILEEDPLPGAAKPKTFIWDHKKTMDYCQSRELLDEHGLFLYGSPQPDALMPLFSTCRSRWSMDIPSTPLESVNQTIPMVPWSEKDIPKLFWRGKMTGMMASKTRNWRASQRIRLHHFAHPHDSTEKISVLQKSKKVGGGWERVEWRLKDAAEQWLDIGLVDGPLQCVKEDGTCDEVAEEIHFVDRVEWQSNVPGRSAFILDVDGNGWSSRMRRVLLGGSVVLKATVFPEVRTLLFDLSSSTLCSDLLFALALSLSRRSGTRSGFPRSPSAPSVPELTFPSNSSFSTSIFIPYYHYIPLQNNYSDLFDILSFFTARPGLAKAIGQQGRNFVEENWKWEDMQAYMLLLLLEYARVMADDREAMSYRP